MPEDQNTTINNANELATERADQATNTSQTFEAPSVSSIEAPQQQMVLPEGGANVDPLPIYAFTTENDAMRQREGQIQQGREQQQDTLGDIYSELANIGTQGQRTIEAEEEAGIPQLNTELTEVRNEIQAKTVAFARERERIETGTGSAAAKNAELAQISRVQNRELADLAIIESARSNTLTNAQNLIQRKLELQFSDEIQRVNNLKFIYEQNKDTLNREDDKLFQRQIAREERGFQVALDKWSRTEDSKTTMVEYAVQNGAPNNVLKSIMNAQSPEEAVVAAGRFGVDPMQQAQIANIYDQIRVRNAQLANTKMEASRKVQAVQAEKQAESEAALVNLGLVNNIYSEDADGNITLHEGFSSAVGAGIGKAFRGAFDALPFVSVDTEGAMGGTRKANFIATHAQLKNSLTLDNLDLMSGVLSETDIKILSSAATRLDLSLSEKEYIKEVQTIRDTFNRTIKTNGITDEQAQFYYNFDQSDLEDVNSFYPVSEVNTTELNPANFY